jgi:hypothetical protein
MITQPINESRGTTVMTKEEELTGLLVESAIKLSAFSERTDVEIPFEYQVMVNRMTKRVYELLRHQTDSVSLVPAQKYSCVPDGANLILRN